MSDLKVPPTEIIINSGPVGYAMEDGLNTTLHELHEAGVIGDLFSPEVNQVRGRYWAAMGNATYAPAALQEWARQEGINGN